ncbi:AP-5 complex subunit beta-1 [Nymphon striatum]|nr:AP-5 complex subunit beta-1 [Nymphon striatum]
MARFDTLLMKRYKSGGNTKVVDQKYKDEYHKESPKEDVSYYQFFRQVIEILWKEFLKSNVITKFLVRDSAIQGLMELERAFPGIMSEKLEEIKRCSQREKSCMFQHYTTFLSLAMKNAQRKDQISKNHCLRKLIGNELLPKMSEDFSVKQQVNYIINLFPSMTPVAIFYCIRNLLDIAMQINDISPLVFKTIFLRFLVTNDAVAFKSVLMLQKNFKDVISSDHETKYLIYQLLSQINHPALKVEYRLLVASWCLENIDIVKTCSSGPIHEHFHCSVFDGADTHHMLQKLLNISINLELPQDEISDILMSSLDISKKRLKYECRGKIVVALFRSLYWFYVCHYDSVLKPEIQKLVLSLIADQAKLAPNVIDFIQAVRAFDSHSSLPAELLSALVKNITKLKLEEILMDDLIHHLLILENASKESHVIAQPLLMVQFLKRLLNMDEICKNGSWFVGNKILSICRSILYNQNTSGLFEEMGDLLHNVSQQYSSDTDVRDLSKFFYAMLTSLSSSKLTSLMQGAFSDSGKMFSFDSIMEPDRCGLRMGTLLQNLDKPVLEILKVSSKQDDYWPVKVSSRERTNGKYSDYRDLIFSDGFSPMIQINLSLKIVDGANEDFDTIFGVVITFKGPHCCGRLPAIFNKENGQTCSCVLPNLQIDFEDYFLPLPVPMHITNDVVWRKDITEELMSSIAKKAKFGDDRSFQKCIFRLHMNKESLTQNIIPTLQACMIIPTSKCRYLAAIFLPPKEHIIVTFKPSIEVGEKSETILVSVFSDSAELFTHLDEMLYRLQSLG